MVIYQTKKETILIGSVSSYLEEWNPIGFWKPVEREPWPD